MAKHQTKEVAATLAYLALAIFVAGCGVSGNDGGPDARRCVAGEIQCDGNEKQVCENAKFVKEEVCPIACSDGVGCSVCAAGTGTCSGVVGTACRADGSGFDETTCDSLNGLVCNPDTGSCDGACSLASLGTSYIGCEYYPTVTGNPVSSAYDFAVVVANAGGSATTVTLDGGALTGLDTFSVPANGVVVHKLPWVPALKLCTGQTATDCTIVTHPNSVLAVNGAYHLRSTSPITVYQFNPLDYSLGQNLENSYSNDASLLLPTNVWRNEFYVATWQQTGDVHASLMAVTAMEDATAVTVTTRADIIAEGGAPAFVAGVPQTVVLGAGDVLELGTAAGDLTGSHVTSDKPVQVIGGHYCANVPDGFGYCDHLEESMFSVDALSTRYIVNAPAVTTIPDGKEEIVRIVATQAGTTLSYDPPQSGAPIAIANPGDFVEISRQAASYLITANHKVLVAQLMEGSTAGGGTGDPAMALAIPVDQFRRDYLFHAPTNYLTNYVDISAPMGVTVTLDGVPISDFTPIGSSGYGLARVTPLGNGPQGDGNHTASSSDAFGITVYGYGDDTSYWYPGGLDLTDIPID